MSVVFGRTGRPMYRVSSEHQSQPFLATARATRREKQVVLVIACISLVAFIVIAPFARQPLAKVPSFISMYGAALLFVDLITSIILYDQFVRVRSAAVLVLASGYFFDALMVIPHGLTFPGVFTPGGLLGAKEQTTAWLSVFWRGGFSSFVIAYVLLRDTDEWLSAHWSPSRAALAIISSVTLVIGLVLALFLLVTWGHDWLPVIVQGGDYSLLVIKGISPAAAALALLAAFILWRRREHVLDLWLLLVMLMWFFCISLSVVFGSSRFDLGFYAGRIFGLISTALLLIVLVVEMAQMYAGALAAAVAARNSSDIARHNHASSAAAPLLGDQPGTFIHRENVARYRARPGQRPARSLYAPNA